MGSEAVRRVTEYALSFNCACVDIGENGSPKFEYAVHEVYWPIVYGVIGVHFVGFADEFSSDSAPFWERVAMFGHEFEQLVYYVKGLFGEVFYDLVGNGVWFGCFT
jgi:hypothetical protein